MPPPTLYFRVNDKHQQDRDIATLRRLGIRPKGEAARVAYLESLVGPMPPPMDHLQRTASPRMLLNIAQDQLCGICGKHLYVGSRQPVTDEHVIPRSRGGRVVDGNKVLAHNRCNNLKGDRWPTGCEVIFLAAVNARLHVLVEQFGGLRDDREAARKREKQRRKRRAKAARKAAALLDVSGNGTPDAGKTEDS